MSELARPRGLGRGLSALLGEPVKADFGAPAPAREAPPQPAPAASAWSQPIQSQQPASPPRNVVELPVAAQTPPPAESVAPPQAPAAQPGASQSTGEGGPRSVAIDLVQRNPGQPRKHFDESELSELAQSIRAHGVLQPILVRPIAGGRYEIVAGERRWRAAQRAGLHAVPVVIRELDELEVLEIAIIENVQRSDLNPIEEAMGFQALIDRFGRTQQDIADSVGKSRPHIANMLRLLSAPEEIQDMVRDGRLSAGHARAILTAPDPRALAARAIADKLNVRDIEKLAQAAKDEKHGPRVASLAPSAPAKDADTVALERSLGDALGLAVTIIDRGGQGGEIKIAYRTLEQLDDLARRLRGGT